VENRKEGVKVFYRLKNDEVYHLFHSLRKLAEVNLAEVSQIMNQYFYAPDQFQAVNRQELITRAQKREVIILDVRPAIEFEVAHLPHAKSIPLKELQNRLAELPKEQEIVAYCRGPYCVLAQEAVIFLRSQGFQAVRMPEGVHEWAEAGLITRN
jgi:rhodanese-related sulfurtransferase